MCNIRVSQTCITSVSRETRCTGPSTATPPQSEDDSGGLILETVMDAPKRCLPPQGYDAATHGTDMTLRRTVQIGLGAAALAVLFVGVAAWATHQQVQATLPADPAWEALFQRANLILIVVTGIGLALIVGLGLYLHRTLIRPLQQVTAAIRTAGHEHLPQHLDTDRTDEIGALVEALRQMTTTIGQRTVSRTYLNNILDSMAEMLFVLDADGTIQRTNRAARQMLEATDAALQGRAISDLLADGPLFTAEEDAAFQRQGYVDHAERVLRRPDGSTLPVLFSRARVQGAPSGSPDLVCVAQDITSRKQAEDQIKAQLQEKEVLLREVHHRVKNNLQIISSLLHLQSKKVDPGEVRDLFAESQARIRSMALIHERLYQSDDLAQVDFAAYLDGLTEHLFRSYAARSDAISREIDAQGGSLSVDRAIPCGLIVNELVTNALQHAFPSGHAGTIQIGYSESDGHGELVVADDGVGAGVDLEADTGSLGLRLVRGLVQQLDGELAIDRTAGLRFTITFPLSSTAHPAHE